MIKNEDVCALPELDEFPRTPPVPCGNRGMELSQHPQAQPGSLHDDPRFLLVVGYMVQGRECPSGLLGLTSILCCRRGLGIPGLVQLFY